jgi:hypothetical protein
VSREGGSFNDDGAQAGGHSAEVLDIARLHIGSDGWGVGVIGNVRNSLDRVSPPDEGCPKPLLCPALRQSAPFWA